MAETIPTIERFWLQAYAKGFSHARDVLTSDIYWLVLWDEPAPGNVWGWNLYITKGIKKKWYKIAPKSYTWTSERAQIWANKQIKEYQCRQTSQSNTKIEEKEKPSSPPTRCSGSKKD